MVKQIGIDSKMVDDNGTSVYKRLQDHDQMLLDNTQMVTDNIYGTSNLNNTIGKSVRITKGYSLSITVPSTDYPDLQTALDDMQSKQLDRGTTVDINISSGLYNYTSQVIADGLDMPFLNIKGATPISISCTGVYSVTDSTFNIEYYSGDFRNLNYHTVTYNVSSVVGVQIGQFVIIKNTSGSTNHEYHQGVWEITSVDAVNNRITVLHTGYSSLPTASLTASFTVIPTVITWVNNTTALLVDRNSTLGTINNIVFVGTGRPITSADGKRSVSGWDMVGGHGGVTGLICRDSSTLTLGSNFGISSFSGANAFATQSAQIDANNSVSCSSARQGFGAASGSSIQVSGAIANGNLLDGIISQDISFAFAKSSIACGNQRHGFIASGGGFVNADSGKGNGNMTCGATAISSTLSANSGQLNYNGDTGLLVQTNGQSKATSLIATNNVNYGIYSQSSHITSTSATVNTNGIYDFYASDMGNMLITSYTGSPVIFPIANNYYVDGSFIKNGTPTLVGFTVNGTNQAGIFNASNHLLLGSASEYTGLTGARLTVAGTSAFGGTLYPSVASTHNLGSSSNNWNQAYLTDVVLTPIATTSAANNSLFVDTADNKLKFKNSTGTVQIVTVT